MGGPELNVEQKSLLERWVTSIPAWPREPATDPRVAEGEALFNDPITGCTSCHSLALGSADVGTGGVFQIPSLVGVSKRLPLLHDGCAATLHDRFDPACGGDQHGVISHLAPEQLGALILYLGTL
jgi:hypothetical protein